MLHQLPCVALWCIADVSLTRSCPAEKPETRLLFAWSVLVNVVFLISNSCQISELELGRDLDLIPTQANSFRACFCLFAQFNLISASFNIVCLSYKSLLKCYKLYTFMYGIIVWHRDIHDQSFGCIFSLSVSCLWSDPISNIVSVVFNNFNSSLHKFQANLSIYLELFW